MGKPWLALCAERWHLGNDAAEGVCRYAGQPVAAVGTGTALGWRSLGVDSREPRAGVWCEPVVLGGSTGEMRKGSYNLYYATAEKIAGPYSERQFVGRFLGHGTPFRDGDDRWWCTAFFNGNVPPVLRDGIETRDLSSDAYTINDQGVTLVPLDVKIDNGQLIHVRAKDPAYATPGLDERPPFTRNSSN